MKHPVYFLTFLLSFLLITQLSQAKFTDTPKIKGSKKVESEFGLIIPQWGVAIDGLYDKKLDNLVPGYKLLNVAVSNRGNDTILLDPKKDKWLITDNLDKTHKAINNLLFVDKYLWEQLPERLRENIEYPQAIRVGKTAKIHLFFPLSTDLNNYRELIWKSIYFKTEFHLHMIVENELEIEKEKTPPPNTKSYQQSLKKYDEVEEPEEKETQPKAPPRFDPNLDDFSITVE